jgi:hypothetical protein
MSRQKKICGTSLVLLGSKGAVGWIVHSATAGVPLQAAQESAKNSVL